MKNSSFHCTFPNCERRFDSKIKLQHHIVRRHVKKKVVIKQRMKIRRPMKFKITQ